MTDDAHSPPNEDRPSSESIPTEQPSFTTPLQQATSLATELAELRSAVTQLRAGLASQIRTRRVEVVDDHGVQRVVMSASEGNGVVGVYLPSGPQGSTCIELFGFDATDGEPGHVGVVLVDGGNVVAKVDVLEGSLPSLWLASEHDRP